MVRPILIVYNPAAGRGHARRFAERLASELAQAREVELRETKADANVFKEIDGARYDLLVVIGGDGSLNAAVNGVTTHTLRFAFGGTGTVNVLSLEAGLSVDPKGVADLILRGTERSVPLLTANDRSWVLFTEAGFLGSIVRRVNRIRTQSGRHGRIEFVTSALRILPRAWGRPLRATYRTLDGQLRTRAYSNVLATRARLYAGQMPLPMEGVDLAAEHFQFVGFRTRTPLGHVFLLALASCRLLPLARRALERLGLLDCVPCTELEVEGPADTGVHIDAESEGDGGEYTLPLRIGRTERRFALLVPSSAQVA